MVLLIGSFLGLFSVAFGAHSEHGLKPIVSEEEFRFLMTAIRYNQVNAVMISLMGITLLSEHQLTKIKAFIWSSRLLIVGAFLFSFSIYISFSTGISEITYLTIIRKLGIPQRGSH